MSTREETIFVAHRGLQPENTLFAFKKAYAEGFLAAECDVQMTKDHQIMVCHDETLKRTAVSESQFLEDPIETLEYAQIKTVLVGDKQECEPVPLLKNLISLIPENKTLFVELKFQEVGFIPTFISCIKSHLDKLIIISFYPSVLAALKQSLPMCKTILLTVAKPDAEHSIAVNNQVTLAEALLLCEEANFDGLGFEYSDFITKENLALWPKGLLTHLWYDENSPKKVGHILKAASLGGIRFVNVDTGM